MNQKSFLNRASNTLLAMFLAFSFVYALATSINFTFPASGILLMIFLCLVLYQGVFHNRLTRLISLVTFGAVAAGTLYYVVSMFGMDRINTFTLDFSNWLMECMEVGLLVNRTYELISLAFLSVLFTLLVYLFTFRKFNFFLLLAVGSTIFVVQWMYGFMLSKTPFYIFLGCTVLLYYLHVFRRNATRDTNEFVNQGAFVLWTIPLCVLAVFVASLFHTSSKPLEWKWLDQKVNALYQSVNSRFDYEVFDTFSVASSGFGEGDGLLGGRVRLDKTQVLRVESPRNVYLKGASGDRYTGNRWINSIGLKDNPAATTPDLLYEDTQEMLIGLPLLTLKMDLKQDFLEKYFYKDKVKATYLKIKTKSIFTPSKMISFTPAGGKLESYLDSNGVLTSKKRLSTDFAYSMELYSPKLGDKDFADMMRKSRRGFYDDFLQGLMRQISPSAPSPRSVNIQIGNSVIDLEDIKELQEQSEAVYKNYLQVPADLPGRVWDLSYSIIQPYDNCYDKVKAIEQFLSTSFKYNLDVKPTPRNRDFVDYFLFDQKEGYCTYFASAMTILARCSGIPARYVEGYILPPKSKDKPNVYNVTNQQAHAWVEVYFEGYGWLPFEPTSPFRSTFYASRQPDPVFDSDMANTPGYMDYMEMMKKYGRPDDEEASLSLDFEQLQPYKPPYKQISAISTGVLILIILFTVIINSFRHRVRLYKLRGLPARECVLAAYQYYLTMLTLQGLGIQPGETPSQYSGRVDTFLFFAPVKFKAVTDIFVRSRYSLNEVSEKEKSTVFDFHRVLLEETRGNLGKFKYFIFKSLLGKI